MMRMQALDLHEGKKALRIDISGYECVDEATEVEFEGYSVRVYTLPIRFAHGCLRTRVPSSAIRSVRLECRTQRHARGEVHSATRVR